MSPPLEKILDPSLQKMMKKKSSGKKAGRGKQGDEQKRPMITDERFASVQSDPRFMQAPKKRSKVSIDSRFHQIFTDPSFSSSNAPTDKRGKPKNKKKATTSLERYYRLKQEDDNEKKESPIQEEEDEDNDLGEPDTAQSETESEKLSDDLDEEDSEDEQNLDESSSTSAEDSDDQYVDEEEDDTFLEPENVPDIDAETRRLAVVNLDWGQVRAVDLYVLLSSFLPKEGQILSVNVYPSEFGLQRMKEEDVHGPIGVFGEETSDDGEDDEIDSKKLRAYELSKLKYYYAVVECDSIATADYLYKTCDGLEFERSANKLDLRFIPDSMEFKHLPRDVATEAPPNYEGLDFQTRALQHSNVELTWDEDEPQRAKTLKRKLTDEQLAQLELKEILASDESETDDDNDGKVNKYRALIQSGNDSDDEHEEDKDLDMEVTFNSGLEDLSKRILEKKEKKSETLWESHLRKRREKRKASKNRSKYSSDEDSSDTDQELAEEADDFFVEEPTDMAGEANPVQNSKGTRTKKETTKEAEASTAELELLAVDVQGHDTKLKGYNLKPKKGKGKKESGIPDVGKIQTAVCDDPRFSALFKNPLFALDPSDPQFKRSATYFRQIAKKQKLGDQERSEIPDEVSRPKDGNEQSDERVEKNGLSTLIKSIKMKSKQVCSQPQGKMRRKS